MWDMTLMPGTMAAAASGEVSEPPASACSWCESAGHCVDKCGKRATWLAKGKAELHSNREKSAQGRKNASKASSKGGSKSSKGKRGQGEEKKPDQQSKKQDKFCFDFQEAFTIAVLLY